MRSASAYRQLLWAHRTTIGLALFATVLSVLAVRDAAIRLAIITRPAFALRLNPSSAIALDAAAAHAALGETPADIDRAAALSRRALRESPLLARPYVYLAMQREYRGDEIGAIGLMSSAVARDPRSIAARSWLLQRWLERGDYPQAIAEVDAITRLQPRMSIQLSAALASLLDVPGTKVPLLEALASNPSWQADFLKTAVRAPGSHRPLHDILETLVAAPGVQIPRDTLSTVFVDMVHNGDLDVAKRIFDRMAGPADDSGGLVFDGGFRRRQTPLPFNWQIGGSSASLASFDQNGVGARSLVARRFGTEPSQSISQIVVLPPGRYQLSTRVQADDMPLDGSFSWRLTCLASSRAIARLDTPKGSGPTDVKIDFSVPAGCDGQTLALWSETSEGSAAGAARFDHVAIRRVGDPVITTP